MRPSEVTISARNSYRRQNRKPAGAAVTIWSSARTVFRPLASTRSWGTKCLPCWTSIPEPIGPIFCTNGYADARRGNGLGPRQASNLLVSNECKKTKVERLHTTQRIRRLWYLTLLLCFVLMAGRGSDAQGNRVA